MTGLPCTGKSRIAESVARALPAALLSADPIDDALVASGSMADQRPDIAGYEVMKALAREQLAVGLSAVIDAVNPFDFVRSAYQQIAADFETPALVIVTSCEDRILHRRRVDERHRAGLKRITWEEIERQIDYYEPFTGDALTLDAANSMDRNIAAAVSYVLR